MKKQKQSLTEAEKYIEDRFREAVRTLRRMPPVKLQGYVSTWPTVVRDQMEIMAMEKEPMRIRPTAQDIQELSNPFLDEVMSRYTGAIEEQLPELAFEGKRYADIGHLSVEFKFGIQSYQFSLHSPRDMDVLKPITIIDGHTIEPSPTSGILALLLSYCTLHWVIVHSHFS